jgi:hypothetical protein
VESAHRNAEHSLEGDSRADTTLSDAQPRPVGEVLTLPAIRHISMASQAQGSLLRISSTIGNVSSQTETLTTG